MERILFIVTGVCSLLNGLLDIVFMDMDNYHKNLVDRGVNCIPLYRYYLRSIFYFCQSNTYFLDLKGQIFLFTEMNLATGQI